MKQIVAIVILIALFGLGAYLVYTLQSEEDVAPDDSSALYGGMTEYGYPSAGYVVIETDSGLKTCGYSVLEPTKAITAAHCVDEATGMYLGKGTYTSSRDDEIAVSRAIQKEGWVRNEERAEDFALLRFDGEGFYNSFASVSKPVSNCSYRLIAYGRTELPDDPPMLRKSAQLCITDITSKTFKITGTGDSGICFGDSGSPIYKEGTNDVVGFVASIVSTGDKDENPCAFNNTAIAVRADANLSLINDEDSETIGVSDINVAKDFTVEVADESVAERLGLNNVSKEEWMKIGLGGTIAGVIAILGILARDVVLAMRRNSVLENKDGVLS
ncbi:trypsin-like serine protease [Candidatus Dojkabacteria bacterium]|nr:trypsin-like serine protease [Candidatus Dojkabacteria bacterium]